MSRRVRHIFRRYVPANLYDPVGLLRRLARSKNREAWFAVWLAALGIAAVPLDILLERKEKRLYASAPPADRPLILVVGASRSGTTITSQTLIRHLPVAYLDNFTSVFPRAPLTAARLFRRRLNNSSVGDSSFYGRTGGLGGPNDGLHIWDRYLGPNRDMIDKPLEPGAADAMRSFFGAAEHHYRRPMLIKTAFLNAMAQRIADELPTAHFICTLRDPLYLAQSLLIARREIHGSPGIPYGLSPTRNATLGLDPFEDVCLQALYHRDLAYAQQQAIGADRFRIVYYEEFCLDPGRFVQELGQSILGVSIPNESLPEPISPSRGARLPSDEFARLERTLDRIRATRDHPSTSGETPRIPGG